MLFNASGYLINSSIDGFIQMKSYLHGNPNLKLSLNDDLVMASNSQNSNSGTVIEDCNFHENVNYSEFELTKTLKMTPPEGEMILMNYRVTTDFNAPFRIFANFEEATAYKAHLIVKVLICDYIDQSHLRQGDHSLNGQRQIRDPHHRNRCQH